MKTVKVSINADDRYCGGCSYKLEGLSHPIQPIPPSCGLYGVNERVLLKWHKGDLKRCSECLANELKEGL